METRDQVELWREGLLRGAMRKPHAAEEKIRTVLDDLKGACRIAELCRLEGIVPRL